MRHLITNKIADISTTSENPEFPVENILDNHPTLPYKAANGTSYSTITGYVIGGLSHLEIANTNAESVSIDVSDPNQMEWGGSDGWGGSDDWANTELDVSATITAGQNDSVFIELDSAVNRAVEFNLVLSAAAGNTLSAGVVFGGLAHSYGGANPRYGVQEIPDDSASINLPLINNGRYYNHDKTKRTYLITALMAHADAKQFMDNFYRHGQASSAMKITDADNSEWVMFGYVVIPNRAHAYYGHSIITFNFIEEI